MRLIHIFTATSSWRDIVESIHCLDAFVDESVIIAHDQQPLPSGLKRTRYVVAPAGMRGFRYWWWAARQARAIIKNSARPNDWIVSEQVIGITLFFLRFVLRCRCATNVFFVFPTFKFLRATGWNADRYARPLKPAQRWFHVKDLVKRSLIEAISILASDVITANSQEILDSNRWLAGKRKLALVPNSVRRSCAPGSSPEKSKDSFDIIFVAAMQPHKGVASALEVFTRVREELPHARLTLVGGCYDWDKVWFENLFARYRNICGECVSYKGKVPFEELHAIYSNADIFLFPSYCEGSPRVVCEAMQYGCAIVTSDLPGNRLIDPDGTALQYFPSGDIDAAVRIVRRLANDPDELRNLRHRSQALIQNQFSSETVGAILLGIYRSTLANTDSVPLRPASVREGARSVSG